MTERPNGRTADGEGGRRQRKKRSTREALLRGAAELFAERGIIGTRIEDITERADLGKGAFYNYFKSKLAIVAALLREGHELWQADYLAPLTLPDDRADRALALIDSQQRFFADHPRRLLLLQQAISLLQRPSATEERELRQAFVDQLAAFVDALAPEQPIPDSALLELAVSVIGSMVGAASLRAAAGLQGDPTIAREVLARGVEALLTTRGR